MMDTLNVATLTETEISDKIDLLSKELKQREEEKIKSATAQNIKLVGKCFKIKVKPKATMFPEMEKYYKIISNRGCDKYRVPALTFHEHPFYWFDYQSHKMHFSGDWFFGEYDFDSIVVDNLLIGDFDLMEEISLEEYNRAMNKYIRELQLMKWPADHYRFGGKLPSDKRWEEHNE